MPPMQDAARTEATLGEICDAPRTEWGSLSTEYTEYTEAPAF